MDSLLGRLAPGSHTISPTAHYTGYVWARHRLGDPSLATTQGRVLHGLGQPLMLTLDRFGGPTLEHFLLARHRIIDHFLDAEITAGRVGQVVVLAGGLSPRGLDFVRRHPDLRYVEVDLPDMAHRKRAALTRVGTDPRRHRVEGVDVFGDRFTDVFDALDAGTGTAVLTEGLLNYFPAERVEELWRRVAVELRRFPHGVYLSDLHVRSAAGAVDRLFTTGLGVFVRGRVHLHYADEEDATRTLLRAGFGTAALHAPREYAGRLPGMDATGADRVRIVEARVRSAPGG